MTPVYSEIIAGNFGRHLPLETSAGQYAGCRILGRDSHLVRGNQVRMPLRRLPA